MTIPLFALLFIPVLILLPDFYPWAGGTTSLKPDVMRWYMDVPWFIARWAIAFVGWTIIAFAMTRLVGRPATLVAAFGLTFHALIIGPVGLDWILSIEPPFISTSFGASLAFTQLICAFAWAAVVAPPRPASPTGDIGGLLLATILGLTYTDFMAVLVIWYGDLPYKNEWFLRRGDAFWTAIAVATLLLASIIPTFALFPARIRSSGTGLRCVGGVTLVGVALYFGWLIGADFGMASLPAALLAMIAMGGILAGLILSERWPAILRHGSAVRAG
jgi:hypothetical protein